MFEKILYPTDFSDVSKKALDYLAQLKDAGTIEIVVFHVIHQREIDAIARYGAGSADTIVGKIEKEAWEEGKTIEKKLKQSGFNVKVRIETGRRKYPRLSLGFTGRPILKRCSLALCQRR